MENFIELLSEVWNRGFLGINLGAIISSLIVLLISLLFRGFIISVIINSLSRLAEKTESKIDDEILNALKKPIGLIPITVALYICTLILPISGLVGDIATNIVKALEVGEVFLYNFRNNFHFKVDAFGCKNLMYSLEECCC